LLADVAVMDAERLDLPDASFDVVLCAFGIFFLPDPEQAASEFRRVLATGGTVAVSTWGAEDPRWEWEDELLADVNIERRAVQRPFGQPADLEALLTGAGFDDVQVEASHLDVRFSDAGEWWAWKWSFSYRGILEQLSDERVERLRIDAGRQLERLDDGNGLPLHLESLFAIGHR
jgi:SAM-dependent methyltransferase